MRGSLQKRGQNSWSIILSLGRDSATGKRRQQWMSVKGTRRDAERRLAELLHQLDTGAFVPPSKLTLGAYLERWLQDYASISVRSTTAKRYQGIVRAHLAPRLGAIPLTELRPAHLQGCYRNMLERGRLGRRAGEPLSARTVHHAHRVLS